MFRKKIRQFGDQWPNLLFPHPGANESGEKNKEETRQPDPNEFTLQDNPSSGAEEGFYAHRRNLDRCPGKKVSPGGKRREERNPAPTVRQGIEEAMARPDKKKEEKIAKPPARKKSLLPEKKKHQEKANDQAQERGMKESAVAKCRVMPEIE